MRLERRRLMPVVLAAALAAAGAAMAADPIDAVLTPGSATLTKCRDWLVYLSCSTYHHIAVPERVALGDDLPLIYGSNPKHYTFHVARIRRHAGGCTILSQPGEGGEDSERLEIAPCRAAANSGGDAR